MADVARWLGACVCAFTLCAASRADAEGSRRAMSRASGVRWLSPGPPRTVRHPSLPLRLPAFLQLSSGSRARAASVRAPSGRNDDPRSECGTRCLDRRSATKDRAVTAAALAGVAASGLGAGLVLVLTQANHKLVPVFKVRLSGQRAGASAAWRF